MKKQKMELRPPIVTVMGHVDHGKTSLLDYIRMTSYARREAGGITQSIGAYQAEITVDGQPEKITFIDTPGHAAFAQMRARGAQVTDLAILVIAADEGVKEQTRECLEHIKVAKIPFIVAINKIDLPAADAEKVKTQLAEMGYPPEEYGGKIPTVEVSAKTGAGVKDLLELIVLMGKMLELRADLEGGLKAVILESRKDPHRGAMAAVIVKNGRLEPRQTVYLGREAIKVRALQAENGQPLTWAGPGQPVEVSGFPTPPAVGSLLTSQPQEKKEDEETQGKETVANKADLLALLSERPDEEKKLKIIIRAGSRGSLETLERKFPEGVEIISRGVGAISENDVFLAQTSGAQIYGFQVKADLAAQKEAQQHRVSWQTFSLIYELLEAVEREVRQLRHPSLAEEIVGQADILQIFPYNNQKVAGCRVTKGKLNKQWRVHLIRQGNDLGEARIKSMRREKQPVDEVSEGNECGLLLSPQLDFQVGDVLISYSNKKSH